MDRTRNPFIVTAEIWGLLLMAMALFVVTVAIGMLNGLDVVEFDHNTLMTHIHAGTLGWITLSVFAVCRLLFVGDGVEPGRSGERLWWSAAWLAIVSVPIYVAAFWSGSITARAITSLPVLATIIVLVAWLLGRMRTAPLTVPRLALLAAVTTLTIGGIFGTLIQLQLALDSELVPAEAAGGGHVVAMAFSYLVLVGMGLVEWRLLPDSDRPSRAGTIQVGALFAGGLILTIGAVANIQALLSLNVLFQLIAVAIFIARIGRPILGAPWLRGGSPRWFAAAGVFVVVDIGLLVFLIVQLVSGAYGAPDQDIELLAIPPWLIFALDHAIFIGVMTNAIFGLIDVLTRTRATAWPWADQVVFWGMNVGLIGFVVGLALDEVVFKQAFSPIMGAAILLGLAVSAMRVVQVVRAQSPETAAV